MCKKGEETRSKVLKAFRDAPDATVRELAERVNLSIQGTYYHLTMLENQGLIKMHHEKGNRNGQYHFKLPMDKLSEIRRNAAKAVRGDGAFKQTRSEKTKELQERIEAVVAKAKEREARGDVPAGVDVIHDFRGSLSIHGAKVG